MTIEQLLFPGEPLLAMPDVASVPRLRDDRHIPVEADEDRDTDAVFDDPPENETDPEENKPQTAVLALFHAQLHVHTSAARAFSIHFTRLAFRLCLYLSLLIFYHIQPIIARFLQKLSLICNNCKHYYEIRDIFFFQFCLCYVIICAGVCAPEIQRFGAQF